MTWPLNPPMPFPLPINPESIFGAENQQSQVANPYSWMKIPNTYDGICDWALLLANSSPAEWSRSYAMIYDDPEALQNDTMTFPVLVRLQGIIKTLNLGTFGTWNGCVHCFFYKILP